MKFSIQKLISRQKIYSFPKKNKNKKQRTKQNYDTGSEIREEYVVNWGSRERAATIATT